MTIREMEIFVKVVECGRMSTAAEQLFISPSSVSQTVAGIEREVGARLFERLDRRLYLTDEGREVLAYMRDILSSKNRMERYIDDVTKGRKRLRAGASVTVGTGMLQEIVLSLREEGVSVTAWVENTRLLEKMLLQNELDIALVEGRVDNERLVTESVIHDELLLACGRDHRFFGRSSVSAAELASQPLILREEGSGTRAQLLDALHGQGLSAQVAWSCSSPEAIKAAVAAGLGVTVISRRLVRAEVERGELWCCAVEKLPLGRTFDIVYHKDKHISGAVRAFMEACRRRGA